MLQVENNTAEILDNPSFRLLYRHHLARAICTAKHYKGTEKEVNALMQTLIELEKWLNRTFGLNENKGFPPEHENIVIEEWQKGSRRSIQDIMGLASSKFSKFLNSVAANDNSGNGILQVNVDGVILPPGDLPIRHGNGDGKFEEARFQERLKELLMILNDNGIYTDDVVIIRGGLRENMMRKVTYAIIEIPKLNREILVCDQVGEATFVIYGIMDRKTLLNHDKETLQNEYGGRVIKIVRRDPAQWAHELLSHLMKDVDIGLLKKINVREIEGLKSAILEKVPTPELWAGMKEQDRQNFKIGNMKLNAIARKFGVKGNLFGNHSDHLELGRKIYGEEHECLNKITVEKLIAKIIEKVPTPELWVSMVSKDRRKFEIGNLKYTAIATKFGIQVNQFTNSAHLELGRKIYGDKQDCLKEIKISKDELIAKILEKIPTPEVWANISFEDKREFRIGKMGLGSIATKFGIEGYPFKHSVYLALGRKIYGEQHECLQYKEKPARLNLSAEDLKLKIIEIISEPESWAKMTDREKKKFKIGGNGLRAIAKKFGLKENPVGKHSVHLELGKKIYGEEHGCFTYEERPHLMAEEIKSKILKLKPTPEEWAKMTIRDKKKFKICGIGLCSIATKLGVKGHPISNRSVFLDIGRKVYGEEHECLRLKEISSEELKMAILSEIPTPQIWANMKVADKSALEIMGIKLRAIATKFGVTEDAVKYHSAHLELGRKIYGEGHECLKKKG